MREIVLDTETTGLDVEQERICEIGCIELFNKIPTGNQFQVYINPQKELTEGARKVSGLQDEFLATKPLFSQVADQFLDFIGKDNLIAHNAPFDIAFLNKELELIGKKPIDNKIIDSLTIARDVFPNKKNNLDALCKRLKIDNTHRQHHGALLDADLTCKVYYILCHLHEEREINRLEQIQENKSNLFVFPERTFPPSQEELHIHKALLDKISNL